ncbi:hypothetical protein [Rhabdochlamydiaceae symbiont of Dictyostelium giganteum]|uniref:hypothetical protein n=1 Tax=Rhabdochlamydiaceae symbiont of Dictyostelium giganteum TaxID=3342349 RepID=UPI00384D5FAC
MSCSLRSSLLQCSQQHISHPSSILNLQEGKKLLKQLIPGSKEYTQLQNLLLKTTGIFEITINDASYKINTLSEHCKLLGGFGGSEHAAIGEEVKLQGIGEKIKIEEIEKHIILEAGIDQPKYPLQFSDIVALAGDFYGIPGEAISLPGGDDNAKTVRFQNAFNTLKNANFEEVKAILAEIKHESRSVKSSNTPHYCYSHCSSKGMSTLKKIKKDYQKLLIDNSDHFEKNAKDAYQIGHTRAIQVAKEAGKTQNKEKLKEAYALDAFACHFLTDLFAAGHIRNQRGDLETFLINQLDFPTKMSKKIAGILTGAQHEKDGDAGLNVRNENGDTWQSYGDGWYFADKSKDNAKMVMEAAQQSVNEIYKAYINPAEEHISQITLLIPKPTKDNPVPLYTIEQDKLILNKDDKKIIIDAKNINSKKILSYCKKTAALEKIISHALKDLPQSYINGFIFSEKDYSPWISKILLPQWERITGVVWRAAGLPTYHQINTENRQLNAKIDEGISTILGEVRYNTNLILKKLGAMEKQLQELQQNSSEQAFNTAVFNIKLIADRKECLSSMQSDHLENDLSKLFEAISTVSYICKEKDSSNKVIFLEKHTKKIMEGLSNDSEIKILVTLWFRQILELQLQAFDLYLSLKKSHKPTYKVILQTEEFMDNLNNQMEANKDLIDEKLVIYPSSYISLQHEKLKTLKKLDFITQARHNPKEQ